MFHFFKKSKGNTSAILVAAGSSTRMGENKMFLMLDGAPVIAKSLEALEQTPEIMQIVVVCKGEDIGDVKEIIDTFGFSKVSDIVAGGATRQQSVQRGLDSVLEESEYLLIHDGARPLVTSDIISCVIADAETHGGATASVASKDTIKIADESGFVAATPNREKVFLTQTPQVFEKNTYLQAMDKAVKSGKDYTDDCQLFEQAGKKVYLSAGSYKNIKLTTPEDLYIAQTLIADLEGDIL